MTRHKLTFFMAAALTAASLAIAGCGGSENETNTSGTEEVSETTDASENTEGSVSSETAEVATSYEARSYTVDEIIEMFGYDPSDYVTLGDYSSVVASVGAESGYTVTDETVTDYIDYTLCATDEDLESLTADEPSYTSGLYHFADVERTEAKLGDIANIDYVGKKDGEAFDGGTAEGYDLILGSGSFIDGFEDGIVGKSVGETFDLELTFPDEYSVSDLAGQDVVFTVTLNSIKEPQAASYDTLTDEDINIYTSGSYTSVSDFYEYVKNYLESDYESYFESDVLDSMYSQLESISDVNIPDEMYEEYIEENKTRQESTVTSYGYDSLEDYLTENDYSMEDYEDELKSAFDTYMIYARLMQERNAEFSEEDYESMLSDIESYYDYMYYQYYGATFYSYYGSYDAAISEYFDTYGGEDKCIAITALTSSFEDYCDEAVESGRIEYSSESVDDGEDEEGVSEIGSTDDADLEAEE